MKRARYLLSLNPEVNKDDALPLLPPPRGKHRSFISAVNRGGGLSVIVFAIIVLHLLFSHLLFSQLLFSQCFNSRIDCFRIVLIPAFIVFAFIVSAFIVLAFTVSQLLFWAKSPGK